MCGGATNPLISMILQVIDIATKTKCFRVPFKNSIAWLTLVILIAFEVGQLYFINEGLRKHAAKFIITLEIIGNEVTQVLAALMAFRSYLYFSDPLATHKVLFSLGLLLAIAGCAIMATGVANDDKSEKFDTLTRYSFHESAQLKSRSVDSEASVKTGASTPNLSLFKAATRIALEDTEVVSRSGSFRGVAEYSNS